MTLTTADTSGPNVPRGTYTLRLLPSGQRVINIPDKSDRTSEYRVNGNDVTFGPDNAGECTGSATYHWTFDGSSR